jgi:hypothetical protein
LVTEGCIASARVIDENFNVVMGMAFSAYYMPYQSLALIGLLPRMAGGARLAAMRKIRRNQRRLRKPWSTIRVSISSSHMTSRVSPCASSSMQASRTIARSVVTLSTSQFRVRTCTKSPASGMSALPDIWIRLLSVDAVLCSRIHRS